MGITQQSAASSLIKPGVIANASERPASPYEGQMVYEKDTDLVYLWNGSAWVEVISALTKAPRGVMQIATSSTDDTFTVEEVQLTATFTAVANRYYKISYFEPYMYVNTGSSEVAMRIRDTNISGTVLQLAYLGVYSTQGNEGNIVCIKTFAAGSRTVVGTLSVGANTGTAAHSATSLGILLVEDIGAA